MEILTQQQVLDRAYEDSLYIPGEYAMITRNPEVLPPDIGKILQIKGFAGLGIEECLMELANVRLVGGTARMIEGVGILIPRVFPMFGFPESLREATGVPMPHILDETRLAYQAREIHRDIPNLDLDVTTTSSISDKPIQQLMRNGGENIFYKEHKYPDRVEFTIYREVENGHHNNMKLSIVHVPSTSFYYPPMTTLDGISFPILPSLKVGVDPKIFRNINLGVIGLKALFNNQDSTKFTEIAVRLLTHSLAEQNGERITVNLGGGTEGQFLLSEWLLRSCRYIIKNRAKYPSSYLGTNLYYKFLYTVQNNWPLIHDELKEIVVKAFQLSYS